VIAAASPTTCSRCGGELDGPWVRFHRAEPFDEPEGHYADGSPAAGASRGHQEVGEGGSISPPDTRSEEQRKSDARPVVEALGWTVLDLEQGWRRTDCPSCGAPLPGGGTTRVPRGLPDWIVLGFGLVAFVEWKSTIGRPTSHQRAFGRVCEAVGVPYELVRTTEQVVVFLGSLTPKGAA
jgi:hypothetical protein